MGERLPIGIGAGRQQLRQSFDLNGRYASKTRLLSTSTHSLSLSTPHGTSYVVKKPGHKCTGYVACVERFDAMISTFR